jgi:hypothetical protein
LVPPQVCPGEQHQVNGGAASSVAGKTEHATFVCPGGGLLGLEEQSAFFKLADPIF